MANKNLKLGEMLTGAGIIDEFQLNSALSHQRNLGGRLGSSLIKLGYINEDRLLTFLADQLNCPRVDLSREKVSEQLQDMLPVEKARQFNVLPIRRGEVSGTVFLLVAMSDPTNLMIIDSLQFVTGCRIRPAIASDQSISDAIDRWYGPEDKGDEVVDEAEVVVEVSEPVTAVHARPQVRTTELKYQALLLKLNELGILTKQEFDELK